MQQPLAIMVIGGLTANMLFTRLVIPAGYLILERRKERPAVAPAPAPSSPLPASGRGAGGERSDVPPAASPTSPP